MGYLLAKLLSRCAPVSLGVRQAATPELPLCALVLLTLSLSLQPALVSGTTSPAGDRRM